MKLKILFYHLPDLVIEEIKPGPREPHIGVGDDLVHDGDGVADVARRRTSGG